MRATAWSGISGKAFLQEIEEHDVGAVAEHQELGVVVPHLREQVDTAVVALAHEVVRGEATGLGDHQFIVHLAQLRDLDLLQLADQVADSHLPLSVELVPVLVVVTRASLEDLQPSLDLLGVGNRVRRDVDAPVHDAVLDPEGGGENEDPGRVGPDRRVGDLGRDRVEGRHGFGEVHRVVEPEPLVVLGLEPGEVGVHRGPPFGTQHVGDLRRQGERAPLLFRRHDNSSLRRRTLTLAALAACRSKCALSLAQQRTRRRGEDVSPRVSARPSYEAPIGGYMALALRLAPARR